MSGTLRGLLIEASRRSAACALAFALVLASPLAAAQSAINTATITAPTGVTDPDTSNNTATDSDTIVAPQLTLAKTANPSSFVIGVAGNYTLTLTNTGTTATTAVATITDTIATGLAIGTLPAGCTAAAQVVTCTVATGLAPGAANAVSFVIPVTPQASIGTTSVANTATVRGGGDATCPASGAVDPRCNPSITTPVVASADVSVTKTDNSATYVPGLTAVYTVVVSNAGPSAASNVLVVDNTPASTTITGWTCAGAACPVASGNGSISQTIPTLASGASVTYTITVVTSAGATGPLSNTATVSSPTPDPVPGNNTATDTDTAVTTSDVAITKSLATPNPAQPGQTVTWTIVVTNNGPSDAVMTASDTVPSSVTGLTLGGANAASCTVAGQMVNCAFGSRSSGDSRTFTISGTLSATATGTLSNTATVATTSTDTVPGNNSATSNTPIGTPANVSVVKTGPATVVTGTSYSYTLTLGNSGQTATGTNLVVQDQLPAGVIATAVSGATCGALPSTPGALLSCTVPGPITGGGSAVVTLTVTAPTTAGAITNYAATNPAAPAHPARHQVRDVRTMRRRAAAARRPRSMRRS